MDRVLGLLWQLVEGTKPVEWATLVADLLIAFVIYYEIEEHRASEFLAGIHEGELYEQRADLYDEYVKMPGETLKDRADLFCKKLWADPKLRQKCDAQWTYFNRLQYMVRHSVFHRGLPAQWFPHVVVSIWVMLASYIRERQALRPSPATVYFPIALRRSLKRLKKKGLQPISIYSNDGAVKITVTVAELEAMLKDPQAPFK